MTKPTTKPKHTPARSARHTPEPWGTSGGYIWDPSGRIVVAVVEARESLTADAAFELKKANAARIVACVNACEGIADPMAFVTAAIGLSGQFDESLAVLKKVWALGSARPEPWIRSLIPAIEAAIARAEGKVRK